MTLLIDACARTDSRTRRLAEHLLERLGGADAALRLYELPLAPLDEAGMVARAAAGDRGDFSAPVFDHARQFAAADCIVIAAPFWDLSFPSVLKTFLESVCVAGLSFRYTESGFSLGLCRAKILYYVSTAGGPVVDDIYGFGYVNALATKLLGIEKCVHIKAENLDIVGADTEQILRDSFAAVDAMF